MFLIKQYLKINIINYIKGFFLKVKIITNVFKAIKIIKTIIKAIKIKTINNIKSFYIKYNKIVL